MEGLACEEVDSEQKVPFFQEICGSLSALTGRDPIFYVYYINACIFVHSNTLILSHID